MPSSVAASASAFVTSTSFVLDVPCVSAGVVVDDDQVGDGLDHRRAQHLGEPHDRRVAVAQVDHPLADDAVAAVEQQHAQLLLRERPHLRPQQALHVLGRTD